MMRTVRHERGAAAVEFALILPLLVLMVAASIDFGRLFYTQNIVVNAAREGARMRVLGYTAAEANARVNQALIGVDLTTPATITYTYTTNSGATTTYTAASAAGTGNCPNAPLPGDRQKVDVRITTFNYMILGAATRLVSGSTVSAPTPNGTAEMRCGG